MAVIRDVKGKFIKNSFIPHKLGCQCLRCCQETRKKLGFQKGQTHSVETRKKISLNNARWTKGLGYGYGKNKTMMVQGKKKQVSHQVWFEYNHFGVPKSCVIHHIDGNKENNSIENLALLPRGYHVWLHRELNKMGCCV